MIFTAEIQTQIFPPVGLLLAPVLDLIFLYWRVAGKMALSHTWCSWGMDVKNMVAVMDKTDDLQLRVAD